MTTEVKRETTAKREYHRKWRTKNPEYGKKWRTENKDKCDAYRTEWRFDHPQQYLLMAARNRAKLQNLPCTITKDDIVIPQFCPVLGIPLVRARGRPDDNSPSLDKIVPELGYVTGNIKVISMKANRLKSDGTEAEHLAIAEYMRKNSGSAE